MAYRLGNQEKTMRKIFSFPNFGTVVLYYCYYCYIIVTKLLFDYIIHKQIVWLTARF